MHGKDHEAEDYFHFAEKSKCSLTGTEKIINITASLALFECKYFQICDFRVSSGSWYTEDTTHLTKLTHL